MTTATETKTAPKATASTSAKTTGEKMSIRDPKTLDYMERATRAREARKVAPQVAVGGQTTIPQKEIIERFARDSGGQGGKFHWMFGDSTKSDVYADQGYEPYVHQGSHFGYEGDPLWRIPTQMHLDDLNAVAARSNKARIARRSEQTAATRGGKMPEMQTKVERSDGTVVMDTINEDEL